MSKNTKRAWRLQELQADEGAINCLSIGHRSGKVMATGGVDKKVNLWALGKSFCIMSLKGLTSAVDSVRFNGTEEHIVAGSQSGLVKIWNLEESKILRTFSGHKSSIKALDFHPFGEIVATGSSDTNIKLWDYRRKGCIFTYKGHTGEVNCIRFSPDGHWIASGGDDGCCRLWDMSTGKQIGEFKHPSGVVTSLAFHPVDFLLTTASSDRTLKFWDLDTFELVSCTQPDIAPIRNVLIHPEGLAAYASCNDYLKVYAWEPALCLDSVNVGWNKASDMVVHRDQLIGASIQQNTVRVHMVDLTKLKHSPEEVENSFNQNPSHRKSFITKSQSAEQKLNESEEKQVDTSCEKLSDKLSDPNDLDYEDIFSPKNELARDVEKKPSTPCEESKPVRPSPTLSLDQKRNARSSSQQNKKQTPTTTTKQPLNKQRPVSDASKRQPNSQRTRASPRHKTTTCNFKPTTTTTVTSSTGNSGIINSMSAPQDFPFHVNSIERPHHFYPPYSPSNLLWGANFDPFNNPHFFNANESLSPEADELSDDQSISCISGGHSAILNVLSNRGNNLQVFKSHFKQADTKLALDRTMCMNDQSLHNDITKLLLQTPAKWTLDVCASMMPALTKLILAGYEAHVTTALDAVRFILRTFSTLIKDTLSNSTSIGVDITKEERHVKCKVCYQLLKDVEASIDTRLNTASFTATQEVIIREIRLFFTQLEATSNRL